MSTIDFRARGDHGLVDRATLLARIASTATEPPLRQRMVALVSADFAGQRA